MFLSCVCVLLLSRLTAHPSASTSCRTVNCPSLTPGNKTRVSGIAINISSPHRNTDLSVSEVICGCDLQITQQHRRGSEFQSSLTGCFPTRTQTRQLASSSMRSDLRGASVQIHSTRAMTVGQ